MTAILSSRIKGPALLPLLSPKWSDYIPHKPTAKQLAFLLLNNLEAFYGGAAGGGKSDALLMAALQYVDVPGYSAILFRKTLADLNLPSSLLHRAHEWLSGTDAKWDATNHRYVFPSSAVLQFGYIGESNASSRYQSAEFQFCGYDEVAQHWDWDYLYMFSRLRRLVCPTHRLNAEGQPIYEASCPDCRVRLSVPIRMRAASNPPRAGDHASNGWLKRRFRIQHVIEADGSETYRGTHPKRPHIAAFLTDNPFIDQASYAESLRNLDPVTREQLLRGNWSVSADGRFKKAWIRYYSWRGDYIVMGPAGKGPVHHKAKCRVFVTCDPAASVKAGPGDTEIWKHAPSWTVICAWLITPDNILCLLDMRRFRKEIPEIFPILQQVYQTYHPEFMGIEANGVNIGVVQMADRIGLPVKPLQPRSLDKLVRATDCAVRMEQGKVFIPETASWLDDCESELFSWTGHPHEPADIIDNFAYAAMLVSEMASYEPFRTIYATSLPEVWS